MLEKNDYSAFLLKGEAEKIKLVTNNICFGNDPELDDEVEQRLTICKDGRVLFSAYNYGKGVRMKI